MLKLPATVVRKCFQTGEQLPFNVVETRIKDGQGALVFVSSIAHIGYSITFSPDGKIMLYTQFVEYEFTDFFDNMREIFSQLGLGYEHFRYVSAQRLLEVTLEEEMQTGID